jgi:hypothetical protein
MLSETERDALEDIRDNIARAVPPVAQIASTGVSGIRRDTLRGVLFGP